MGKLKRDKKCEELSLKPRLDNVSFLSVRL